MFVFVYRFFSMDIKVQVASKGARRLGRMPMLHELLGWLENQGVARDDVFLSTVKAERGHYRREEFGCNLVTGVLGLGAGGA